MDEIQDRLKKLDKRIIELKEILNEISVTTDEEEIKLFISQYLDKLIVEYMKTVLKKI
ncbi:hypothetical protein NBE98_17385 [Clostridium swellfunianum]|uniref:hypothetical protein n=1 Tax=Clostridium swellfunianum TaxID=1367462 RepID=UPI00202FC1D0|nr:hypothetical protein [Clostridium swellfunianum]MCM0650144.1 hypothetical protein [Clostridium swellfunianum]